MDPLLRDKLRDKASRLPAVPGVYLMKNSTGIVIYVGKAKCLPDRVSSYFLPSTNLGPRKQPMLEEVAELEHLCFDDEWQALLAESRLIKDLHPKYNARLVDDKSFPYLVLTTQDAFPGVYITRNLADIPLKKAKVLGPFVQPYALKESVSTLQKVFQFRTCSLEIIENNSKNNHFRPCLLHAVGRCSAPCANKIDKQTYRKDMAAFLRVMSGRGRKKVIKSWEKDMKAASKALKFEQAARLRDQIQLLQKLDQRGEITDSWQPEVEAPIVNASQAADALQQALDLPRPARWVECFDIAHLQGTDTVASSICFLDGRPFKKNYRRYKIKMSGNDDYNSMREAIARHYRKAGQGDALFPDIILIDGGLGQLNAAWDSFNKMACKPHVVWALAKKEETLYSQTHADGIKLSRNHVGLRMLQAARDEAHRFSQHYHKKLRSKRFFNRD